MTNLRSSNTDLDHVIDWQKAEIIAPEKHWYTVRIREAIEIHKHDTVPQDIGYVISSRCDVFYRNQTELGRDRN